MLVVIVLAGDILQQKIQEVIRDRFMSGKVRRVRMDRDIDGTGRRQRGEGPRGHIVSVRI